jgi:hypothetical protein
MRQATMIMIAIHSSILALDESAFMLLTDAVRCGSPGFSGFNDEFGRKLFCPSYGRN